MPNLQQRAELLRIAEAMHTSSGTTANPATPSHSAGLPLPPNMRSSSQDRECKDWFYFIFFVWMIMIIDFCIFLIPVPSLLDTACSLCGADTQSPNFRPSDHGENLCGRGTISCPLCAKTFSLWSHYEAHKKCHQKLKQRQYPCATCGKVSANPLYRTLFRQLYIYFKMGF